MKIILVFLLALSLHGREAFAIVDDQAGEVIRKAADDVQATKSSYAIRTKSSPYATPPEATKTEVTYPSDTTEVFTHKKNSTVLRIVTVTYTDNTKENISSVEVTGP